MLTIRNWLIGYYIVEFEQNGKDRAEYGKSLLKSIAKNLSHIKGMEERSLRRFRQFYLFYPQIADTIRGSVTPIFEQIEIRGSLNPILQCHVLIELKIGEFEHGDIGQLNTYLNYFKEEICEPEDNHPVGILLVAEKDHALVKYATAGMNKNLFVKQYMLKLPDAKVLKQYLENELKEMK